MKNGDYLVESNDQFRNFCITRGLDPCYAIEKLVEFWETSHKVCIFCQGFIAEGKCIYCGRSDDFEYEMRVKEIQKRNHHNWHQYGGKGNQ